MYQERDYEIIDYQLYQLPGTGFQIRGPQPKTLEPGEYFTCVGAAQTFGCFTEEPYPALLSGRLGLAALNLGFAGAGPRFFMHRPALLDYIKRGRFAILQVMSARSEDNSRFDTGGREYLTRRSDGQKIGAEPAYKELLANESRSTVDAIVAETRQNWVQSYRNLVAAIEIPVIVFWFSERAPDYEETYTGDIYDFFGKFPQLVNRSMIEQIKNLGDDYVECISDRGLPQRLISRFTGEPTTIRHRADLGGGVSRPFNPYYPSPEMHLDAADALIDSCRRFAAPAELARD